MAKREIYNASGCKDLTSYYALNNIETNRRFEKFKKELFKLSDRYGFRIESRIVVSDKKTGKVWK